MKSEFDYSPYFQRYEQLVGVADDAFQRVQDQYPELVRCKTTCSDCCHALFDLTLIEALYINHNFQDRFKGQDRETFLERANTADRDVYKLKREAFKALKEGKPEDEILFDLARQRVRCPLLNHEDLCEMYDKRPITCRLYGIPTTTQGTSHTCGLSGFKEGTPYPSASLDNILERLFQISGELTAALKSRFKQLPSVLVPLSMALLTVYDEKYLGLATENDESTDDEKKE